MPDFFIAGHQKCGTTALYLMLGEHPQIFMPRVQGAALLRARAAPAARARNTRPPAEARALPRAVRRCRPDQRAGEASPQYMRSPTAAARIAELHPDARMIVILREPAAFLRSFHMQMVASHDENEKDFRKAIELEPGRRANAGGGFVRAAAALLRARALHRAAARLHASFPAEQVLVLSTTTSVATTRRPCAGCSVPRRRRHGAASAGRDGAAGRRCARCACTSFDRAVRPCRLNPAQASGLSCRAQRALCRSSCAAALLSGLFRRVAYASRRPPDEQFMRELKQSLPRRGRRLERVPRSRLRGPLGLRRRRD